jgi:hypothetical protein
MIDVSFFKSLFFYFLKNIIFLDGQEEGNPDYQTVGIQLRIIINSIKPRLLDSSTDDSGVAIKSPISYRKVHHHISSQTANLSIITSFVSVVSKVIIFPLFLCFYGI